MMSESEHNPVLVVLVMPSGEVVTVSSSDRGITLHLLHQERRGGGKHSRAAPRRRKLPSELMYLLLLVKEPLQNAGKWVWSHLVSWFRDHLF